jgi:transposase InsO family protein
MGHPGKPTRPIRAPHDVWSAACQGHCHTGDGRYCYPRIGADGDSRLLLGCQARSATRVQEAKPVCTRVCKACGLPTRIRTDNGGPCAPNTLARRSPLSAWWVRLGLLPACMEPGTPQQNGRHKRRHRPLNADTTRPQAANSRAQPRTFTRFRKEFNTDRPHEALDIHAPAPVYEPKSLTASGTSLVDRASSVDCWSDT